MSGVVRAQQFFLPEGNDFYARQKRALQCFAIIGISVSVAVAVVL